MQRRNKSILEPSVLCEVVPRLGFSGDRGEVGIGFGLDTEPPSSEFRRYLAVRSAAWYSRTMGLDSRQVQGGPRLGKQPREGCCGFQNGL